jgi:hypothetical protein
MEEKNMIQRRISLVTLPIGMSMTGTQEAEFLSDYTGHWWRRDA